eukprot:GHVN01066034.1.p1 GENE.GHVN01066034.1~~GHVN01066034.1.p1  ORF type:complete len:906 (-),score=132.50 GHVN01066034.1:1668-4385(-)
MEVEGKSIELEGVGQITSEASWLAIQSLVLGLMTKGEGTRSSPHNHHTASLWKRLVWCNLPFFGAAAAFADEATRSTFLESVADSLLPPQLGKEIRAACSLGAILRKPNVEGQQAESQWTEYPRAESIIECRQLHGAMLSRLLKILNKCSRRLSKLTTDDDPCAVTTGLRHLSATFEIFRCLGLPMINSDEQRKRCAEQCILTTECLISSNGPGHEAGSTLILCLRLFNSVLKGYQANRDELMNFNLVKGVVKTVKQIMHERNAVSTTLVDDIITEVANSLAQLNDQRVPEMILTQLRPRFKKGSTVPSAVVIDLNDLLSSVMAYEKKDRSSILSSSVWLKMFFETMISQGPVGSTSTGEGYALCKMYHLVASPALMGAVKVVLCDGENPRIQQQVLEDAEDCLGVWLSLFALKIDSTVLSSDKQRLDGLINETTQQLLVVWCQLLDNSLKGRSKRLLQGFGDIVRVLCCHWNHIQASNHIQLSTDMMRDIIFKRSLSNFRAQLSEQAAMDVGLNRHDVLSWNALVQVIEPPHLAPGVVMDVALPLRLNTLTTTNDIAEALTRIGCLRSLLDRKFLGADLSASRAQLTNGSDPSLSWLDVVLFTLTTVVDTATKACEMEISYTSPQALSFGRGRSALLKLAVQLHGEIHTALKTAMVNASDGVQPGLCESAECGLRLAEVISQLALQRSRNWQQRKPSSHYPSMETDDKDHVATPYQKEINELPLLGSSALVPLLSIGSAGGMPPARQVKRNLNVWIKRLGVIVDVLSSLLQCVPLALTPQFASRLAKANTRLWATLLSSEWSSVTRWAGLRIVGEVLFLSRVWNAEGMGSSSTGDTSVEVEATDVVEQWRDVLKTLKVGLIPILEEAGDNEKQAFFLSLSDVDKIEFKRLNSHFIMHHKFKGKS